MHFEDILISLDNETILNWSLRYVEYVFVVNSSLDPNHTNKLNYK